MRVWWGWRRVPDTYRDLVNSLAPCSVGIFIFFSKAAENTIYIRDELANVNFSIGKIWFRINGNNV